MFEQNVPPNLPVDEKKVEDIFAPVESVKPTSSQEAGLEAPALQETPRTGFKRLFFVSGGVVVIVLLLWGGYALFKSFTGKKTAPRATPNSAVAPAPAPASAPTPVEPAGEIPPSGGMPQPEPVPEPEPEPAPPVDTDGDGLTDDQEIARGTSPSSADTDGDTLTDREEVNVYRSDPLNPDTDGDSYQDGHEVQNGYNPTGPGKLLPSVPAQ